MNPFKKTLEKDKDKDDGNRRPTKYERTQARNNKKKQDEETKKKTTSANQSPNKQPPTGIRDDEMNDVHSPVPNVIRNRSSDIDL